MNTVTIHAHVKTLDNCIWIVHINDVRYEATDVVINCKSYTTRKQEKDKIGMWRFICHPERVTWQEKTCILD
jgi:hypothetical protein